MKLRNYITQYVFEHVHSPPAECKAGISLQVNYLTHLYTVTYHDIVIHIGITHISPCALYISGDILR